MGWGRSFVVVGGALASGGALRWGRGLNMMVRGFVVGGALSLGVGLPTWGWSLSKIEPDGGGASWLGLGLEMGVESEPDGGGALCLWAWL